MISLPYGGTFRGPDGMTQLVTLQRLRRHHVAARPEAAWFLYLDGHVRVSPAPQAWIGDADGDPVMVLTAAPSQSRAAELYRLLPDLRALLGPDRRCTVVFDRGGNVWRHPPRFFAAR